MKREEAVGDAARQSDEKRGATTDRAPTDEWEDEKEPGVNRGGDGVVVLGATSVIDESQKGWEGNGKRVGGGRGGEREILRVLTSL